MMHWRLPPATGTAPEVTVLLAMRNGARFLPEQLDSIARQHGVAWRLIASDDGSTDGSRRVLRDFALTEPRHRVALTHGPRRGAAANFLHLLTEAGAETPFAALSDQDDVWLPGKLTRAVSALSALPAEVPALYCGRTVICAAGLEARGLSPLQRRQPSFRNALTQNIAGGNTMVLNRAALTLAQAAARDAGKVPLHDWWLYQLITGAGGRVLYDCEPMVLYRQHGANEIGANASALARIRRAWQVAQGRLRRWNDGNIAALTASAERLTPENRALLAAFAHAKRAPLRRRIGELAALRLYRQTAFGHVSWWCAAAAGLV